MGSCVAYFMLSAQPDFNSFSENEYVNRQPLLVAAPVITYKKLSA
jgi:hypothetical protein